MKIMELNIRCYICDYTFVDNEVYERMFDPRLNVHGAVEASLASILSTALDTALFEHTVHSTLLCSSCKVRLLNFEELQRTLCRVRDEIFQMHLQTAKKYGNRQLVKSDSDSDACLEHYIDLDSDVEYEPEEKDAESSSELVKNESNEGYCTHNVAVSMDEVQNYSDDGNIDEFNFEDIISESGVDETADEVVPHSKRSLSNPNSINDYPCTQLIQRPFICEHCGKGFTRNEDLRQHIRTHTGERPFKCEDCPATFAQRSNWRTHRETVHLNAVRFICPTCGKGFKRRRLLNNHNKAVHEKLRDIKCVQCDATFSNPINYAKHLAGHTGAQPYTCEICGKHFSRQENRNIHRFMHSNAKPYACGVCGEGYMRKAKLLAHMEKTQHLGKSIVRNRPDFSRTKAVYSQSES